MCSTFARAASARTTGASLTKFGRAPTTDTMRIPMAGNLPQNMAEAGAGLQVPDCRATGGTSSARTNGTQCGLARLPRSLGHQNCGNGEPARQGPILAHKDEAVIYQAAI